MTIRTVLIVVLALVCGLSAVALFANAKNNGTAAPPPVDTVPVVVAVAEIGRGTTITREMVTVREMARKDIPPEVKQSVDDVLDRVVDSAVPKGSYVLEGHLAKGGAIGLAAFIPDGMRAVTITTPNVASGVAGLIRPKNRVDVLITVNQFHPEDRMGGAVTLLQNVEILAVDGRMDTATTAADAKVIDQRDLRSVTLLVKLDEAALLDLAMQRGVLYLAMRNPNDKEIVKTRAITPADLPFPPAPKPIEEKKPEVIPTATPEEPPSPPPQIRTIRGVNEGRS